MKLSKRKRYWLKWNGPKWSAKSARSALAEMGHARDPWTRIVATIYVCRHRGFYPRTDAELCRRAGVVLVPPVHITVKVKR